jgi:metallo-beta-lactamase family protein
MKIKFCGGARTVTGSQVLLSVNGSRMLLECGLFQGKRQESYEKNLKFMYEPSSVQALLLTHAHMDHSGNIPNLVKHGFSGPIYATPATCDLCKIMLRDSAYLQERDLMWVNRIRSRQGQPKMEPLYTPEDADASMELFKGIEYDTAFSPVQGVVAAFQEGGHILGSAAIRLDLKESGRQISFGFSGDIGRPEMPLIRDPDNLRDIDVLVMESTYGDRRHTAHVDTEEYLARLVNETVKGGGKVIIPAFALGRTQLLVYIFHKLYNENRIPDIPIFVDSPLACHATEIFKKYENYFDRQTARIFLQNPDDPDPLEFKRINYISGVEDSKKLNSLSYPHIIISASGMAEGGRILHHLRNGVDNHKNLLLFVGYAAKDTLARKIMDGERKVKILGEEHTVKCRVESIDSFSAHADRRELLDYVGINDPARLKTIFIMHGEEEQSVSLKDALRSKGYQNVHIPAMGEEFEL